MKVLDLTLPTPAENLACDEALLEAAEAGQGGEVLRFWESPWHFVVAGYANKLATEVNIPACTARGIPILRRCSGGGTVVQGPGCLSYALILRIEDGFTRTISSANQGIMERNRAAVEAALQTPPATVHVRGHTDLALGDLKFSGNSQRRRRHFLLVHGTLLLNFDLVLVAELLRMPTQQPDYRACRTHGQFITNLNLSNEKLKAALCAAWGVSEQTKEIPESEIRKLVAEKYSRDEWNLKF